MNGGVRAALAILVILFGVVLVVYAIQGMWPLQALGKPTEPAPPHPGGKPPEPAPPHPGGKPPEPLERD